MSDYDADTLALIGEPSEAFSDGPLKPKRGRPPGSPNKGKAPPPFLGVPRVRDRGDALERLMRIRRDDLGVGAPTMDMTDTFGGVSVGWLSKVFGMDPTDVKKRLADCPPLHRRKAGYIYDLKVAARFLVKPVFDIQKYLREMKPSELPSQLQKEYWDANLKRQKWEENAGHLWRTEAVLEVLGDTFKLMKFSMQLWADSLERMTGLSIEQKRILVEMVDTLQNEIHEALIVNAAKRKTPNTRGELDDNEGADEVARLV